MAGLLPKQISMLNVFILLITCNIDSSMPNRKFSCDNASIRRLLKPLSYDLTINLLLDELLVFNGVSTNLIIIGKPTLKMYLKAYGLKIRRNIRVSRYPYMDHYNTFKRHYSNETGILSLYFDRYIPSGFYNVTVTFFRDIFKNEIDVYRTSCEHCTGETRFLFMAQLEPNGILPIFPCWDKPASRARFGIAVRHYKNYTTLSNMPIQSQRTVNEYITRTRFYPTPPMRTDLVALSLTDFVCFTKEERFTTRVCSKSLVENQTTFALETSASVVFYMVLYTEMLPQFPEITFIGLPDPIYQNAENLGFNIFREDQLIYDESLHPVDHKLEVSIIVASLAALPWFNHLFNSILWTHVWFCQTLALFYGAKAFAETYHDGNISSLFTYGLQHLARENDIVREIKPISYDTNSEDVDKLNTYDKKHIFLKRNFTNCLKEYAVMVMLENAYTEPVFRMAVISYLKKQQFSTVTPNDFWDVIQDIVDKEAEFHDFPPIAQVMKYWLIHRSLPVVHVTTTEKSFIIEYVYTKNDDKTTVLLPINYVMRSNPRDISRIVWLVNGDKMHISKIHPINWIVVNWRYTGYYRVKYDPESLKRLADYLNSQYRTNIDVLNRAHIIDDAYYFWTRKELKTDILADIMKYFLSNEEECTPWYALQNIIQQMWIFFNYDIGRPIKGFVLELLNQLIQKVGYIENPSDTDCVKFKRFLAMKWTCRLFDLKCLRIAEKRLKEHLENPESHIISPLWEEWTYCNGLMFASEFIRNKVWTTFMKTGNKKILTYLVCSEYIPVILNYTNLVISEKPTILHIFKINFEDREKIYHSIVQKHIWKKQVIDHILNKIVQIKINDVSLVEKLSYIIDNVYSFGHIGKISTLLIRIYHSGIIYDHQMYESLINKLEGQISRIQKLEQLVKKSKKNRKE